jgi:hypothetical protein
MIRPVGAADRRAVFAQGVVGSKTVEKMQRPKSWVANSLATTNRDLKVQAALGGPSRAGLIIAAFPGLKTWAVLLNHFMVRNWFLDGISRQR